MSQAHVDQIRPGHGVTRQAVTQPAVTTQPTDDGPIATASPIGRPGARGARHRVLGGLFLDAGGGLVSPTAPKVRQVLALLLANASQLVPAETIMTELWPGARPCSASTTTQTYVYQLRKLLADSAHPDVADYDSRAGATLTTRGNGYVLDVAPTSVDEQVFRELVREAQREHLDGSTESAHRAVREALRAWHDHPYAEVEQGPILTAHVVELEDLHTRAVEIWIETGLALGLHRDLVSHLRRLVTQQPLNEWLHQRLIEALGRCGRRSEALEAFQDMRRVLDIELGLTPSQESRRLQSELLNA